MLIANSKYPIDRVTIKSGSKTFEAHKTSYNHWELNDGTVTEDTITVKVYCSNSGWFTFERFDPKSEKPITAARGC